MPRRCVCRRVLKLLSVREGSLRKWATAANRTREIRPSGMRGGLSRNVGYGELGPRRTIERVRVGNPPPKAARAALLPDDSGFGIQR